MDSFSNFVEIQKLKKELSAKSGNLVRYVVSHVAETDGQTLFPIELSTFNFRTDSVWVVSGRTMLSATRDYVVQSQSIVLNEGVPAGRTVDIYVYKNVENPDTEKVIDGRQLGIGSIPLDRLAELPVPISAGGTGATNAEEALAYLGGLSNYLGNVSNANLLTWFTEQAQLGRNGCFIVDPSVTKEGLPLAGWYGGMFSAGGGFALIFALESGKIFVNMTVSGAWQNWKELFTTEGGTLSGLLKFDNLSDYFVLRKGRKIKNIAHWMTMGVSVNGETTLEHYTNDEGVDTWDGSKLDSRFMLGSVAKDPINALRVTSGTSGQPIYKIYGEHNITKSTTGVTANSTALSSGCIHLTYE